MLINIIVSNFQSEVLCHKMTNKPTQAQLNNACFNGVLGKEGYMETTRGFTDST